MAAQIDDWRNAVDRTWIIGDGVEPFDFDAVISEAHTSRLAITDNPVETGVVVSDHAFMLPRELEVNAIVSDVWTDMRDADNADNVSDLHADKAWLVPADTTDSSARSQRAFELLLALQQSANPFSVQTGLMLYENMLVSEITATQDAKTAGALIFRAVLREILIVSTETVTYPPRADGKPKHQLDKKTTSGEKQAAPPAPEKKASNLLTIARGTGVVK